MMCIRLCETDKLPNRIKSRIKHCSDPELFEPKTLPNIANRQPIAFPRPKPE